MRTLVVIVMLACGALASAQGQFCEPPASAIAWWRFIHAGESDPARAAAVSVVEGALRSALGAGLVKDDDAVEAISAVLIAGAAMGASHQTVLLECAGGAKAGGVTDVRAVVTIRGADHHSLVRTLQSILVDGPTAAGAPPGSQRTIALAGGREAIAFRRASWPAWLTISWTSSPDAFTIGIGHGALEEWFGADPGDGDAAWLAHRRAIATQGTTCFEAYVDLDALRRSSPAWFGHDGTLGRLLRAWDISNARCVMLHARLVEQPGEGTPPVLAVDATWESRSRKPGAVRRMQVTPSAVSPGVTVDPASVDGFVMVAPFHIREWVDRCVRTYAAVKDAPYAEEFLDRYARWQRQNGATVMRLAGACAANAIVTRSPRAGLGAVLPGVLIVELDTGVRRSTFEHALSRLMATLGDSVAYDADARIWSLRLESGDIRPLAWGVVGERRPMLVVGWGPAVIEALRAR